MKWRRLKLSLALLAAAGSMPGCRQPAERHYFSQANNQYYRDYAQSVEYPTEEPNHASAVLHSDRPRTIRDRRQDDIWDLSLQDAVHTAIANNKMIRFRNQFLTSSPLLSNPSNAVSVYDPAIRETGVLFGGRGVEAALADFDTQLATGLSFGRNQNVFNSGFASSSSGSIINQDTGTFTSSLTKVMANGGQFSVNHNWNYLGTNQAGLAYPSAYSGLFGAQYRQPLWAGSGTEFTRIAGPVVNSFGGISGVTQGVSIARINVDMSIADFELSVINMVRDVEDLYWELYLAYRQYDADLANRNSALRSWEEVKTKMEVGVVGGSPGDEALARDNYFDIRSQVETSLASVYTVENQFRRLLGLPVNDGRLIRPADAPIQAEYTPNWEVSLSEALTRRAELRRQKWQIKSFELQYAAAKSLTNPRLDFVGNYQLNGFGSDLLAQNSANYNSAYSTLTQGNLQGWNAGFQFTMPLGFRSAMSQLRNVELQMMKARAALNAQELDVSHELADAMQKIDVAFTTARTNLDRRIAAEQRVSTTLARYEVGDQNATLDLLLRAQASRAQAEIAMFTSLIRYNQAITEYHLRKGTLLDNNNITLAEGEWSVGAYEEAQRRAHARSHARETSGQFAEPAEFATPNGMPTVVNPLIPHDAMGHPGNLPPTPAAEEPAATIPPRKSPIPE